MEQEIEWPLAKKIQALMAEINAKGGHAFIVVGDEGQSLCSLVGKSGDIMTTLCLHMKDEEAVKDFVFTAVQSYKIADGFYNLGIDKEDIPHILEGFAPAEVEDMLKGISEN